MCDCKYQDVVDNFDNYYSKNYKLFNKLALKHSHGSEHFEDYQQDAYIRLRNRICLSGFTTQDHYRSGYTGYNFYQYLLLSIQSVIRNNFKKTKSKTFISLDDNTSENQQYMLHSETETVLNDVEHWNDYERREQRWEDVIFTLIMLDDYLKKRFEDDRAVGLFWRKTRFNFTYKELALEQGLHKRTILRLVQPLIFAAANDFPVYFKQYHNDARRNK